MPPGRFKQREIDTVINYALKRLGHTYDLRNIIDLARYLLPTPQVPQRFRRRLLSLESSFDPHSLSWGSHSGATKKNEKPFRPQE
jgi:hypothetical protein